MNTLKGSYVESLKQNPLHGSALGGSFQTAKHCLWNYRIIKTEQIVLFSDVTFDFLALIDCCHKNNV